MAYILCPKHGGTGAAAVCAHVAEHVWSTSIGFPAELENLFPVRVSINNSTLGPTWLCATCAKKHGVPLDGLHLHGEDGLARYFDVIGFTPVCPHCFEEKHGHLR